MCPEIQLLIFHREDLSLASCPRQSLLPFQSNNVKFADIFNKQVGENCKKNMEIESFWLNCLFFNIEVSKIPFHDQFKARRAQLVARNFYHLPFCFYLFH